MSAKAHLSNGAKFSSDISGDVREVSLKQHS